MFLAHIVKAALRPQQSIKPSIKSPLRLGKNTAKPKARSDCFVAPFARSDPDAVFHGENKDLAVTNFALVAATAALQNRIDCGLDELFVHSDLKLNLSQQVHPIVSASDATGLAPLPTKTLAIDHRQTVDFDPCEGLFNRVEPRRLNDCND